MARKNVTLSIDSELIDRARREARKRNTSVNALIRQFLSALTGERDSDWIKEFMQVTEQISGKSKGKRWTREELYDV